MYFVEVFPLRMREGALLSIKGELTSANPRLAQSTKQSPNLTLVSGKVQRKVGKGGPVRVQTEK